VKPKVPPQLRAPSPQNSINILSTLCILLYNVYENEPDWPEVFIRAYVDDSLNERIWVDNPNCKDFVENIQTAFATRPIPFSTVDGNNAQQPSQMSVSDLLRTSDDNNAMNGDVLTVPSDLVDLTSGKRPHILTPRYVSIRGQIEAIVKDMVDSYMKNDGNKQRQPIKRVLGQSGVLSSSPAALSHIDNRNFLKLLQNTCGFAEIRAIVMSKLDGWLGNAKVR
jgi:integrator complex subunit 1